MSFQILPNLIFLFAVLGIIILVLRRIPGAMGVNSLRGDEEEKPETQLREKGVPAVTLSETRKAATAGVKKAWRFMLEAKGLTHNPKVSHRINKLFKRSESATQPGSAAPAALDESYYIDQIKRFPKDWQHYNNLGQYYLDSRNYEDALGVYEYLTKQDSVNGDYWARLGFVKMSLADYKGAVEGYEKAVGLDSSHPNRYYNLGLAYIETRKKEKASQALEEALKLEPENTKYAEALAEAKRMPL